ncbi:MAG TPA: DUF3616 domain-containing protein [Terriglobales bacterium]|nr:DUF3616 domain-containing protein [Terriglobales bacterium]
MLLGAGCSSTPPAASPALPPRVTVFEGSCDASGAVAIDHRSFVVADDEDNVLRIYDAESGGRPIRAIDVSPTLFQDADPAEADLEAATRLGDLALWLTSHGRNQRGGEEPNRLLFFATTIPRDDQDLHVIGRPYRGLLGDLIQDPQLQRFDLEAASQKPPKSEGGLNIEGMTATAGGHVLIGMRNPVPDGLTLLVVLENPAGVFERDEPPKVRDVYRLDLGGRGVRALSWWRGRYLIAAGNPGDGGQSRLFTWRGGRAKPEAVEIDLAFLNPEGFFTPENRDEMMVLSDDGETVVGGTPCKYLQDPSRKTFRGAWLGFDVLGEPPDDDD